jgi:hypothetical protein
MAEVEEPEGHVGQYGGHEADFAHGFEDADG